MTERSPREVLNDIDELLDEVSHKANYDELTDQQKGMLKAAERIVATVYEQRRNAIHLNEWHGKNS